MNYFARQWKQDKLRCMLVICWLLAVVTSFFNSYLLPVELPGVGTWYAFRFFLPLAALLYVICAVRDRRFFWKDSTTLEKWCYVFGAILILYGVVSLPRALDVTWTFRRLFNLCFDVCFFFLMLRLCRKKDIRRLTLQVCFVLWIVMMLLGIYEVFNGGLVDFTYNGESFRDFTWFLSDYQYPVVFFGNTNDYAIMLIFFYAIFAVDSLRNNAPARWVMVLTSAVTYFLLLACGARLCLIACLLMIGAQIVAWILRDQRRAARYVIVTCLCLACVWLGHQWRFTVEPMITYCQEYQEYRAGLREKPTLILGNRNQQSLDDQFFVVDETTGEKTVREDSSAGARTRLMIHAWNCFCESRGLGIGLGNTETLAARRGIVPAWADKPQNSIHCFIARLIADYGIFALIPLAVIAVMLLRLILRAMLSGFRRKDYQAAGCALLLLAAALIYPIVSTASSDAQDNIPMWIYLAILVLLCAQTAEAKKTKEQQK